LDLIVVLIDDVNVFKLPVLVSIDDNLPLADDVNEFNDVAADSIEVTLVFKDELNKIKSIPSIVPVNSIEPDTTISFANTTGVPPTDD
jgi:hypothetical protein